MILDDIFMRFGFLKLLLRLSNSLISLKSLSSTSLSLAHLLLYSTLPLTTTFSLFLNLSSSLSPFQTHTHMRCQHLSSSSSSASDSSFRWVIYVLWAAGASPSAPTPPYQALSCSSHVAIHLEPHVEGTERQTPVINKWKVSVLMRCTVSFALHPTTVLKVFLGKQKKKKQLIANVALTRKKVLCKPEAFWGEKT